MLKLLEGAPYILSIGMPASERGACKHFTYRSLIKKSLKHTSKHTVDHTQRAKARHRSDALEQVG